MIDRWLQAIGAAFEAHMWLAPLLALAAGVLTSFLPCSLSSIPLVIGYVGGNRAHGKRAVLLSLTFALGSAITFTALGTAAALMGNLLGGNMSWWYIALGVLMVLMALQIWEIFNFIPATFLTARNRRKGYLGALLTGLLGGLFSSPCSTPVLIALLAIVAGRANVLWGILLLMLYSIGHGALAVVAGSSVGLAHKLASSPRYAALNGALKIVLGAAVLAVGLYMFYMGF